MPSKLVRHELHTLRVRHPHPVRWSGHVESAMDVVLLVLETDDGRKGVAEMSVRLLWHAATPKSFKVVLEEVFLPLLLGVDLQDEKAVNGALSKLREHPLAKAIIDAACWDVRASVANKPLWKTLGAANRNVSVSWTVTRAAPIEMAREAERMRKQNGFAHFKVKTGQGFEIDGQALREIRSAVGSDVTLYADSNSAHKEADVPEMSQLLADNGVSYFEDPCRFIPNGNFRLLQDRSVLPILVDNGCRSMENAILFLDAGARALSVKTIKTGISDSLAIARQAQKHGAKVSVGLGASTSLGALATLSLSAALPDAVKSVPCEETFFAGGADILREPLQIRDGEVRLPEVASQHELVDWKKVAELSVSN